MIEIHNNDGKMTLKTAVFGKIAMILMIWMMVFAFGSVKAYAGPSEEEQVGIEEEEEEAVTDGQDVVDYARQFIGNPYRYGGMSLTKGTDCSGFVKSVFANFGYNLPHHSQSMMSVGTAVASLDQAEPGDIIVYPHHVGIYVGDGQLLSALGKQYGIIVHSATYSRIKAIRRLV